ncbi:type I-E CRISPR-associated endonuclease Cas1e [Corynebacterium breve]
MPPPSPQDLSRAEDRLSFLYLEHCTLGRDGGAITATDERGIVHIPVASLSVLLLGPGTRVTHQAVTLAGESGCCLVWVGEQGVRYYAHGRPLARTDRLLAAQAEKVSNQRKRLAVARQMYSMRFPGEDTSALTMQQLRGKEGARVRRIYSSMAKEHGVEWYRRDYRPDDFESSDPINQALTAANTCVYGLTHSVIVALGCSPGLGFIHTGNDRSFVYDIADLYKAELAVPVAFETVAEFQASGKAIKDLSAVIRRRMRDVFKNEKLIARIAVDVKDLLVDDDLPDDAMLADVLQLWDETGEQLASGTNYADE